MSKNDKKPQDMGNNKHQHDSKSQNPWEKKGMAGGCCCKEGSCRCNGCNCENHKNPSEGCDCSCKQKGM